MDFTNQGVLDFLREANAQTWVINQGQVRCERPGFERYEYRSGPWHYRDEFSGSSAFAGTITVSYNDYPVWAMNYAGSIIHENDVSDPNCPLLNDQEVTDFLRQALRATSPDDLPFRGPSRFSQDGFTYTLVIHGDIPEKFHGFEAISYLGRSVYTLTLHGVLLEH